MRRTTRPDLLASPEMQEFAQNSKLFTATWLIPPLLSARYRGHGEWIDKAFDAVGAYLDAPAFEELIEKVQQEQEIRTIEADRAESEPIRP